MVTVLALASADATCQGASVVAQAHSQTARHPISEVRIRMMPLTYVSRVPVAGEAAHWAIVSDQPLSLNNPAHATAILILASRAIVDWGFGGREG